MCYNFVTAKVVSLLLFATHVGCMLRSNNLASSDHMIRDVDKVRATST